jgi:putative flippase GtrA
MRRLLKFNAVAAMGMVVHLGLLGIFVHLTRVHYVWATALAVEAAILHNFVWHCQWTWADRCGTTLESLTGALLRFNLTNGLVSLASSMISVYLMTGIWHWSPILSNVLSFGPGGLANFLLSNRIVFRSRC